jgi:hypothetical protein
MSNDSPGDDADALDDAGLDELVEPSVELRTAQEREHAEPADVVSGEATSSCSGELESDVLGGVDELVDPSTEFRTAQEREAANEDAGGESA